MEAQKNSMWSNKLCAAAGFIFHLNKVSMKPAAVQ